MAAGEDLDRLLRGMGVNEEHMHVIEPLGKNAAANVELISREISHRGLSIIIARRACLFATRNLAKQAKSKQETASASA
jgi:indolepyruvate ferredoxin oxidoreductase alpha subunit